MMLGGGMMLGLGLLTLLFVIGLPILLIVGGVVIFREVFNRRSGPAYSPQNRVIPTSSAPAPRYCSHCGYGLQAAWTHCPSCGAPIETK